MNMSQVTVTRPRAWPWLGALVALALAWIAFTMYENYQHWQATGLMEPMGNKIRNGVLAVAALLALGYAAVWGSSLLSQKGGKDAVEGRSTNTPTTDRQAASAPAILSSSGAKYVLEARSLGVVVNRDVNHEIWEKIEQKADNFSSFLSQSENDYPDSADMRLTDYAQLTGLAFREAAGHAVEYWPIPTIIWGPPRDPKNDYRAAADISGNRQQAGLGVHLFLWSDDANTNDGPAMVSRLFDFFDKHPDVPAVLVFCEDGDVMRYLVGPGGRMPEGRMVPTIPNSIVGIFVSRSDRVDKLIRPFAVDQSAAIDKDTTQYDVTRLWNYYWAKSDDRGPDSFRVSYINEMKDQGFDDPSPVNTMRASWWQNQLPAFWKQISNKGPGDFKPTLYLPIRWTTWQVEQFDNLPLIGYLHRPVDVKLTNGDGKLLPNSEQITALKNGWTSALGTLEPTTEPKRVFYDTTGDRQWAIPITQALSQEGTKAPDIGDVKQGYDIGRRIGNTGVSSPMVQLGLGLMASYKEGGASATINRRPDGNATIMMISPPDAATRAAWQQQHGGRTPF